MKLFRTNSSSFNDYTLLSFLTAYGAENDYTDCQLAGRPVEVEIPIPWGTCSELFYEAQMCEVLTWLEVNLASPWNLFCCLNIQTRQRFSSRLCQHWTSKIQQTTGEIWSCSQIDGLITKRQVGSFSSLAISYPFDRVFQYLIQVRKGACATGQPDSRRSK